MHYIGMRTGGQWTRRVTTGGTEGVESKRHKGLLPVFRYDHINLHIGLKQWPGGGVASYTP